MKFECYSVLSIVLNTVVTAVSMACLPPASAVSWLVTYLLFFLVLFSLFVALFFLILFNLNYILYCSIVDLQCVSFKCTAI